MAEQLRVPPITEIKTIIDQLVDLGINALQLQADTRKTTDHRPDISIWLRTRTDFETYCAATKAKPTERRYTQPGQRHWYVEQDTPTRRLLVQCVSFQHHDDWQPRLPKEAGQ